MCLLALLIFGLWRPPKAQLPSSNHSSTIVTSPVRLDTIPPDILGIIFKEFVNLNGIQTLKNLCRTCKQFNAFMKIRMPAKYLVETIADELKRKHSWVMPEDFDYATAEEIDMIQQHPIGHKA